MKPELRFEKRELKTAHLGKESCLPDLSGEVIVQNQLAFRLNEEDEIYEGYGRMQNGYPYRLQNDYERKPEYITVQTAVLENDHLKAVFLPSHGGRLWELWDKETGENLLYTNDIIQYGNLAVRGAWFSGGVEWNISVIGHTPFTAEPLYAARTEDGCGNPVLRMYEYERIRNVSYQMDFWLEEDSRFLNCRMRIVNEHNEVIPMYWWSNMAVPEYENGRVYVPATKAYTHDEVAVTKVDIPIVDGVDITDYKTIPSSVDYFFEIADQDPKYIVNASPEGHGLLQFSTGRLKSRKLFTWGKKTAADHWQEFLTENAGRYVEIQAGLGKTQFGCIPMAPNTAWEWMEQYGPLKGDPAKVGEFLKESRAIEKLEEKLRATKAMALQRAVLVSAGSGYGILGRHGKYTAHLQFVDKTGIYTAWKTFIEGGRLPIPDPAKRPDAFLNDAESLIRLREAVKGDERDNWYAQYQYGVRCYVNEKYKKAGKAFEKSLQLAENAWALHGLACVAQHKGNLKKAAGDILRGMELQKGELSYLKDGFKLLCECGQYEAICRFYENLDPDFKKNSRLKYCYIVALHRLGRHRRAYELLEENGGLVLADIREGEDSFETLWRELTENLFGKAEEPPYRYQFKAH